MSDRITIKSIAQDLGVSHMTVSRALSNSPTVREETRRAVQARARELGYVKSAAAAAMRGDSTRIVGLLLPNLVNEFYARFSNSLAQCCAEQNLQVIIHLTGDDLDKERQSLLKLREIQAHAVVMVPTPGPLQDEERYLYDLTVIQLIRKRDMDVSSHRVLVDDSVAISDAVQHLAGLGHRRVAYIGAETSLSSGLDRLTAFRSGMHRAGLDAGAADILTDIPSFLMGYRAVQSLLERGRTTALVCGGVEISNGALIGCLENGMSIPSDMSFIGYGDPSSYRWINGGISTISIPVEPLAAKTAELLGLNRLETQGTVPHHSLPAELVIRASTRPNGS